MNALRLARLREGGLRLATAKTNAFLCLASRPTVCLDEDAESLSSQPIYFARSSAYNETVHDLVLQETPIKREVDPGIQERMASIACAIKMPTLKTNKKMSNQVPTAISRLGSEPSEDSLPQGGLSSERKKKECADDGGREKWKPNVWHFKDSDSLRRIKCAPRSQFSWFSLFSTAQKQWLPLATNSCGIIFVVGRPRFEAMRSRAFVELAGPRLQIHF
jgi:hypothetical protein